jgi:hypothetical protein
MVRVIKTPRLNMDVPPYLFDRGKVLVYFLCPIPTGPPPKAIAMRLWSQGNR